jgi:hypothetical protein
LLRQRRSTDYPAEPGLLAQLAGNRDEIQTLLKQPHPGLLALLVVNQRVEQSRPQAGSHHRQIGGNRIGQRQRLPLGVKRFLESRIDKTVGNHFLKTALNQGLLEPFRRNPSLRLRRHFQPGQWPVAGQTVIAVNTNDLLNKIRFQR